MDFTENIRDIHIGSIIEKKLTEKSMTKTELAERINRSRSDVNDILKRKSIDTRLLIDISKVLEYDFIHNVYYKYKEEYTAPTVYIAFQIKENEIRDLPEKFIRLVTPQK